MTSFYLAWGIIPYIIWVAIWIAKTYLLFKVLNTFRDKFFRQWAKGLVISLAVVFVMFPWKYSTQYYKQGLTLNAPIKYDVEMVERDKAEESWEARSKRQLEEARKAADERTINALKGEDE